MHPLIVGSAKAGVRAIALLVVVQSCKLFDREPARLSFYARDTGQLLWENAQVPMHGQPWIGPNAVYVLGPTHEVQALNKFTGAALWKRTLPVQRGGTVGFGGVRSDRGVLYVGDERLFALDEKDGTILWEFSSSLGVDIGRDTPVLWNDIVMVGSSNGYVIGVDALTGVEKWRTVLIAPERGVGTWVAPVVAGRLLVGATDFRVGQPRGQLASLDAATGTIKWTRNIPVHLAASSPSATSDAVGTPSVAIAASTDGPVYGYDLASGDPKWKIPPIPMTDPPRPDSLIRDFRELVVCSNLLVVTSTLQIIIAADPETGREIWRTSNAYGSPLQVSCDNRSVFVMTWGSALEVFELTTGRKRWELAEKKLFGWSVTPDGDRVFGGGLGGAVAARNP